MRVEPFDKLRTALVEVRWVPFDRLRAHEAQLRAHGTASGHIQTSDSHLLVIAG